jgi:Na+/melibiose symporter-like transporter
MLGSAGYLPEPDADAIQPESARMVMYLSVGGLPVITLFISCLLMIFYKLDTTKLKQ